MVAVPEDDVVRFNLPSGQTILAGKAALAHQAAFFAPLVDESGPASYGDAELQHLMAALSPGAQKALPLLIDALGSQKSQEWSSSLEKALFSDDMLLHTFAAAHLLGATQVMDAARQWASANGGQRLVGAVAAVDAKADAGVLRTAAEYGLDRLCSLRLLHAAAEADARAAAEVLVSAGDGQEAPGAESPWECRDAKGHTPLQVCAIRDSSGVASVLLQASADVDALCDPLEEDEEGDADMTEGKTTGSRCVRTALHLAAYNDSAEVLQVLLDAKANVATCVKDCPGALTPLHECASSDSAAAARILASLAAAAADASSDELSKILGSMMDAEPAEQGEKGEEDMGTASCASNVQWARFLDPLQAKVGHNGSTPLHTAAENDAAGVVAALLEAKADPSLGDDQGDTPVHCAMLYGSPRALEALLAMGAQPSLENGSGELPLHLMAEFGTGGDDGELPPALEKRHFARSLRAQDHLVESLRARGLLSAALSHRACNDFGNTPLHSTARWDHVGAQHAVELLVSAKADLELQNEEGKTALSISLRRYGQSGKVAALLRKFGAQESLASQEQVDFAGALGGYVRPLAPSQPGGATDDMEVEVQPVLPVMETQ